MIYPDTDVIIDIQPGLPAAVAWFEAIEEPLVLCGLVIMELHQSAQDATRRRKIDKFVEGMTVVWPTEADCARALNDFRQFHLSDNLGLLDSLIGECAVGLDVTLYTFNTRHYRTIPNLTLVEPYSRA